MNFDGKIFRSVENTENGEVNSETIFYYHQNKEIITAEYSGGDIRKGHLIGKTLATGQLDIRYQHINKKGELMAGTCISDPEILSDGRIKLREKWRWLTGDQSSGNSVIEEVKDKQEISQNDHS